MILRKFKMLRVINFFCIYLISLAHLGVALMPFCTIFYIILKLLSIPSEKISYIIILLWIIALFFVNLVICIYIILDCFIGITVKKYSQNASNIIHLQNYSDLASLFQKLKIKFNAPKVYLYIQNSDAINAYALGSLMQSRIILTTGILKILKTQYAQEEDYKKAILGILGHEMSHIVNMDFIPGLFTYSIEKAIRIISAIFYKIIAISLRILSFVPLLGKLSLVSWKYTYKFINYIFYDTLYKTILVPVDSSLKLIFSRYTEYRADRDSAKASGGEVMMKALNAIDLQQKNAWKSIFSTHPATKWRVKKVAHQMQITDNIHPSVITDFANAWCILMLFFFVFFLGYICKIHMILEYINLAKLAIFARYHEIYDSWKPLISLIQSLISVLS